MQPITNHSTNPTSVPTNDDCTIENNIHPAAGYSGMIKINREHYNSIKSKLHRSKLIMTELLEKLRMEKERKRKLEYKLKKAIDVAQ